MKGTEIEKGPLFVCGAGMIRKGMCRDGRSLSVYTPLWGKVIRIILEDRARTSPFLRYVGASVAECFRA